MRSVLHNICSLVLRIFHTGDTNEILRGQNWHFNPLTTAGPVLEPKSVFLDAPPRRCALIHSIAYHWIGRTAWYTLTSSWLACVAACGWENYSKMEHCGDFCILHQPANASHHKLSLINPACLRCMSSHTLLSHTMIGTIQSIILVMQ